MPEVVWRDVIVTTSTVTADIADAVTAASLDMPNDAVAELELTVADPGLRLWVAGLFELGAAVRWRDLALTIAAIEVDATTTERVTVRCRSTVAQALRRREGASLARQTSVAAWLAAEAAAVGGTVRGPVDPTRAHVSRAGGDQRESTWQVAARAADDLDWWLFEHAGTVTFAPAEWLAANPAQEWRATWLLDETTDVLGLSARSSDDDDDAAAEIELSVPPRTWSDIRPGHTVTVSGVGALDGTYVVSSVGIDLSDVDPIDVRAVIPRPPKPRKGSGQ